MNQNDFTATITVDQTPQQVYDAINNVRGWWSEEIEGDTTQLNSAFRYHYEDVHRCQMKIIETDPGKRIVWLVEDNYFNFTKDEKEWIGDKIIFDISEKMAKRHWYLPTRALYLNTNVMMPATVAGAIISATVY